jgi:hypothetical protein
MELYPPSHRRILNLCPRCEMGVKLTGERDRLVYYVCDSCGTKGAFAVSSKDFVRSMNNMDTVQERG